MVIHFLQCAVDPPILPNLISLYPDLFDGTGNVENLRYDLKLQLPSYFYIIICLRFLI